jgi:hypothetical protein
VVRERELRGSLELITIEQKHGLLQPTPLTRISSRDSKSKDKRGEFTYESDSKESLDTWCFGSARSPT